MHISCKKCTCRNRQMHCPLSAIQYYGCKSMKFFAGKRLSEVKKLNIYKLHHFFGINIHTFYSLFRSGTYLSLGETAL